MTILGEILTERESQKEILMNAVIAIVIALVMAAFFYLTKIKAA